MSDPTRPPPHGDEPAEHAPPSPPQPPVYGARPGEGGGLTPDEVTWGGAAHWGALVAAVVALAFLGPLIVLLFKGNESPYVRRQAVESLNFQLSVLIYAIVSFVLIFVVIGFVLLPLVGLFWLVFTIVGSVKAARGEEYRYPATIRIVS
ncbi:MAG TPA: DUF4870 domain-containing protein [Nocardioides sp.]|nr:DUF4870 domain-containing protein [Nocardioides sp.]